VNTTKVGLTLALAEFAATTGYEDIPARVIDRMKTYTLDCLAAGFVCARLPWARIVLDLAAEAGGRGESSVFGSPGLLSASQAALVNGVMIGGFESEHVGHVSHPAGTVTPAALALAERDRVSGRQFLVAAATGYEVVCRIGEGQTARTETIRGFHNPAVNGPFSAAAAAGRLLGFDTETMASALGIAGSFSSGLTQYAFDGSMTKRLHLGHAARSGLEAALLAAKGFTGPHAVLEGENGYFQAFSPDPKPERVLPGLGRDWLLETLRIKAYACHATGQAIVAALQQLRRQGIDLAAATRVSLHGQPGWASSPRYQDHEPTTLMGAQYSVPFTIAVALVRDLDDPLRFDESAVSDEQIRKLAQLVTVADLEDEHDPEYSELDLEVDGTEYHLECGPYRGSVRNPADFDDVAAKFRRFSRHLVGPTRQAEIIDLVARLDEIADISELTQMIRGEGGR